MTHFNWDGQVLHLTVEKGTALATTTIQLRDLKDEQFDIYQVVRDLEAEVEANAQGHHPLEAA